MDELDDQIAQELIAALKELREATAAAGDARLRGGPPLERARAREEKAMERVRVLARRLGRS